MMLDDTEECTGIKQINLSSLLEKDDESKTYWLSTSGLGVS